MKPLKILLPVHFFYPNHFYGTETYTLELAQCLKKMGHDPIILTARSLVKPKTAQIYTTYEYDNLIVYEVNYDLIPVNIFGHTYYNPNAYDILKKIITKINPDIAHVTHLINHTGILLEIIKEKKIPTIATLTDFFGMCYNNRLEKYDGTFCLGPNRRSTNCLMCHKYKISSISFLKSFNTSSYTLKLIIIFFPYLIKLLRNNTVSKRIKYDINTIDDIIKRYEILLKLYDIYRVMITPSDLLHDVYYKNGFYPERLKKINFGIKLNQFQDYQSPKKKNNSNIRFGYIGQITPHKGVDILIKAFNLISSKNKSLAIYGSSDQDPVFMKKLTPMAEGKSIEFKGTFPAEELPQKLSEIDVLVIPSRWYENSPLVLLNSLAARTPAIVTDVQGMTEFIKDGYNGFTFKMNDCDELTDKMQRIVDNPKVIETLSENATYEKDVMDHAKEVVSIYEHVLQTDHNAQRNI